MILSAKNNEGTELLSLYKLYQTSPAKVHVDNYCAIRKSIAEEGMVEPLVVWETTASEWLNWYNLNYPNIIGPPQDLIRNPTAKVYLVMCGNNRMEIAREAGYDYISCIIKQNKEECSKICNNQRKYWKTVNSRWLEQQESRQVRIQ